MNWEHVEGHWQEFKGLVREKWGKLTDNDLEVIAGKKDRLLGKLRERYANQRDGVEDQVDHFIESIDTETASRTRH